MDDRAIPADLLGQLPDAIAGQAGLCQDLDPAGIRNVVFGRDRGP
jgi:hypothetical protein